MGSRRSAPSAGSPPSTQVVGNAFVHQYYQILHQSPELVYRFYQGGSKLGRPDPQGVMSSVTTMQTIKKKILSMDYSEFRAEIKTVDSQESLEGGLLVLVTGYLTGKDNVRRNFTQSFFLAIQHMGYYVLNDIFRYVEDADHLPVNQVPANNTSATHSPKHENPPPQEQQLLPPEEEEVAVDEKEVYNPHYQKKRQSIQPFRPCGGLGGEGGGAGGSSSSPLVAESSSVTAVREEEPKKSYALIVKVKKETTTPLSVPAPAAARPPHASPERQTTAAPTPAPAPEAPAASLNFMETSSVQEPEVDGHSVYIKNLPLNATPTQLEEKFQMFGPIKPGGIQVRSNKQQGFCFGFVEFEVASAVQSAIEASPVMIGGRQAYVEEKRPTVSRDCTIKDWPYEGSIAVESSTATTARDAPSCTIKDCLDAMDATPGVERGTLLFIIGARLFLSRVHREMFIQLGDDKTRLQYLQYEQQRQQQQQVRRRRSDNPPS